MAVEIPIQVVIEKYKQNLADVTQRAIIAETAQEILEQQVSEANALARVIAAERDTLRAQLEASAATPGVDIQADDEEQVPDFTVGLGATSEEDQGD